MDNLILGLYLATISKKTDEIWQKAFSKRLRTLITSKGYTSAYDFWIQECGDSISRSNLDNMLNGKVDPKISTLRKLAKNLNITLQELINGPDL